MKLKVSSSEYEESDKIEAVRLFPPRDVDFICERCRNLSERCDECSLLTMELHKLPKFEIDCTMERGEAPVVNVRRAKRIKNDNTEIELWFKGDNSKNNPYHFEKISYSTKPPEKWEGLGYLVFTPAQAYNIGMMLIKASRMLKGAQLKFEGDVGESK